MTATASPSSVAATLVELLPPAVEGDVDALFGEAQ